jgi:hypothetical protein
MDDNILNEEVNKLREIEKGKFLINVKDEFEASIIETKLWQAQIPILKIYKEAGSYNKIYFGNIIFGIDIFVPSQQYSLAQELIKFEENMENDISEDFVTEELTDNSINDSKKYLFYRKIVIWVLIALFIPGIILSLYYSIYTLFSEVFK